MNNALQKLVFYFESNFWDWQFVAFIIFSILIFALYLTRQKARFDLKRKFEFSVKCTGKSEIWNYLLVAAVSLFMCLLVVSIAGIPIPQTHDEFAYLLSADTFLHGRLSNPTPFSPNHFEYFHILVKPVYAAKYPPLQGLFLAAGTIISGSPIAGVWLSSILSGLAVYWFLRHRFARGWSLYGSFFWIAAPLNIIWSDSYWGGHAAVIGGAISLGAFFRFLNCRSTKYLFVWGTGIFILLNSRVYEGTILTGILVLLWLYDSLKNKTSAGSFYTAAGLMALIIAANLLFIAFYNYSITGHAVVLPYSLQHSQYHRTPLFVFQNVEAPKPDVPPVMRRLDEQWTAELREKYKNWFSTLETTFSRVLIYLVWMTRSPFLIALFLAGLVFTFRKQHINDWKNTLVIFGLFICGLFLTTFTGDRFVAPVVGIFIAVVTLCAKTVYEKWKFPGLLILSFPLIIGSGFLYGMFTIASKRGQPPVNPANFGSRREIENFLLSQPGKNLLFLETGDALPADARFYVYNRAEIADSEIIWAHKLGFQQNAALINHFKDRTVWLLKNVNYKAVLVKYDNQIEQPEFIK
jgi:hypothetical protein